MTLLIILYADVYLVDMQWTGLGLPKVKAIDSARISPPGIQISGGKPNC